MSGLKRLTPQQSRKANALIKKTCCNCMGGNCILLDDGDECVCPQAHSAKIMQSASTSARIFFILVLLFLIYSRMHLHLLGSRVLEDQSCISSSDLLIAM